MVTRDTGKGWEEFLQLLLNPHGFPGVFFCLIFCREPARQSAERVAAGRSRDCGSWISKARGAVAIGSWSSAELRP